MKALMNFLFFLQYRRIVIFVLDERGGEGVIPRWVRDPGGGWLRIINTCERDDLTDKVVIYSV